MCVISVSGAWLAQTLRRTSRRRAYASRKIAVRLRATSRVAHRRRSRLGDAYHRMMIAHLLTFRWNLSTDGNRLAQAS